MADIFGVFGAGRGATNTSIFNTATPAVTAPYYEDPSQYWDQFASSSYYNPTSTRDPMMARDYVDWASSQGGNLTEDQVNQLYNWFDTNWGGTTYNNASSAMYPTSTIPPQQSTGEKALPGADTTGSTTQAPTDPLQQIGYYDEYYTNPATGQSYVIHKDADGNIISTEPYNPNPTPDIAPVTGDVSNMGSTIEALTNAIQNTNLGDVLSQYTQGFDKFTTGLNNIMGQIQGLDLYDPTAVMNQINSLAGSLETMGGGTWMGDARENTAKNLGYNNWAEMQADMQAKRGATREGMQGLTDAESAEYDRMIRMTQADMERRAQSQLEAVFANTGSAIQYMSAADEINQSIVDQTTQMQFEKMNQNMALQLENLKRNDEQYVRLIEQGQMGISDYMNMRANTVFSALNGYVQEAQLGMQQNQQEIDKIVAMTDATYKAAMTQLGIDQGVLDLTNQWRETSIAPYLDILQAQLANETLDAQTTAAVLGMIGQIGGGLFGGAGSAIGGALSALL